MPKMDTQLFYAVNHGMQNSLFDWLMPHITKYRNWIPIGFLLYGYIIWRDKTRGAWLLLATVVAVTFSDFVASSILKNLFAVPRPCITLADVHLLAGCSDSGSFPSSHAVNSATLAVMLGLYDRKLWFFSIPAALCVAFSRVYLGVHYPSDVLFGALLGAGIGWAAIRLARQKVAAASPIK